MGMYCSVCGTQENLTEYKDKYGDYWDFRCSQHLRKFEIQATTNKIKRNKLCPCGSNIKYKKCCNKKYV